MAEDWSLDVKKHVPDADDGIISGIVRYCGIALHNRDSSLVSFGDKTETNRVRENFLKKKLGLTDSDDTLDEIIARVGERLKGDRTKNRVTAYYMLAEETGKLPMFQKAGAKGTASVQDVDLPPSPSITPPVVPVADAPTPASDPVASIPTPQTSAPVAETSPPAPPVESVPPAESAPPVDPVPTAPVATPTPAVPPAPAVTEIENNVQPAPEPQTRPVPPAPAITAIEDGVSSIGDAAKDGAAKVSDTAKAGVAAVGAGLAGAGAAVGLGNGSTPDPVTRPVADIPPAAAAERQADDLPPVHPPREVHVEPVEEKKGGMGWLLWLLLGLLLLGLLWYLFGRGSNEPAPPPPAEVSAPVEAPVAAPVDNTTAAVTIPTGAGVTTETRDGKPAVIVYFDTAKSDVVPAFTPAAATLKTYLDANAGSKLAVSGFNDPRGDAAMNAKLSKDRAEAVKAALVKAGIAGDTVELVKPSASTDTDTSNANARRVEVVVQ